MTSLSNALRKPLSVILIACAIVSAAPIPKGGGGGGGHSSGGGSRGSTSHASSSGSSTYVYNIGGTNHCYSDEAYKNEISCPKSKLSQGAIFGMVIGSMIGVAILIVFALRCIKKIQSIRKKTSTKNPAMLVAPTRPGLLAPSTPTSALPLIAEPNWPPDSKADEAVFLGAKGRIHHDSYNSKRTSWITPPPPYHPNASHKRSHSDLAGSPPTGPSFSGVCS
ncbi:hypothetical protein DFS33DRAFT_1309935 [Desarmillaria ectypa]|nr:hypothetical protein DFS33DRAFT_1309935 [Desarmillaria ectypa]